MSFKTQQLLQKKKKNILELWMKNQLADEGLREDLISNDELRSQSEEWNKYFQTYLEMLPNIQS